MRIDAVKGEITIYMPLDKLETEKLSGCVTTPEAKAKVEALAALVRENDKALGGTGEPRAPTAYERQLDFFVPLLCVAEADDLFEFESTWLLEQPWKLGEKDASLSPNYDPLKRPSGKSGVVDVGAKGQVTTLQQEEAEYFVTTVHQQALELRGAGGWTLEALAAWLDKRILHRDIPVGESAAFLRKAIRGLMSKYGMADLDVLALDRFRLRDEIEASIERHRDGERMATFKQLMLPGSPLSVTEAVSINFKTTPYEPSWVYEGGFQFRKHYYGSKPGELREKRQDGKLTEEFQCAQFLDAMPEAAFWVRNISGRDTSFRLQTSKNRFYPDFVRKLVDGRTMVVEYKGAHLMENAEEKRLVGQIWASRSEGRCVFVMPTELDFPALQRRSPDRRYSMEEVSRGRLLLFHEMGKKEGLIDGQ